MEFILSSPNHLKFYPLPNQDCMNGGIKTIFYLNWSFEHIWMEKKRTDKAFLETMCLNIRQINEHDIWFDLFTE